MSRAGLSVDARVSVRGFELRARFEAPAGISVVFGPSASGKTLLLDLVAGLVRAGGAAGDGAGFVRLDGRVFDGRESFVPPHLRPTGYAAQQAALWPHRTVRAHVEPFATDATRARRLIDRLGLAALARPLPGAGCRVGSGNGWRSRERWRVRLGCSCSTSR